MIERGGIHWADLGEPIGSRPAGRRPVVVVQVDTYTRTRLSTVVIAAITSNLGLASARGNVFLPASESGLARDSVVNVTAVAAVDRREIEARVGTVPLWTMQKIDTGLRLVLGL